MAALSADESLPPAYGVRFGPTRVVKTLWPPRREGGFGVKPSLRAAEREAIVTDAFREAAAAAGAPSLVVSVKRPSAIEHSVSIEMQRARAPLLAVRQPLRRLLRESNHADIDAIMLSLLHDVSLQLALLHDGLSIGRSERLRLAHCDVTPGNVVLAADGRGHLIDFGAARCIAGFDMTPSCEVSAAVAGWCDGAYTPGFEDPRLALDGCTCHSTERCDVCSQVTDERGTPVAPDAAVDIYSLAVTLEWLLGVSASALETSLNVSPHVAHLVRSMKDPYPTRRPSAQTLLDSIAGMVLDDGRSVVDVGRNCWCELLGTFNDATSHTASLAYSDCD
jgi:serine/threonine protein kinase